MKPLTSLLTRFAAYTALIFAVATPALAGPPLICHRLEIGTARSLPWNGTAWDLSGNENYDTRNLVRDTVALLDNDTPVIVRMETLRRATLYARKDPQAAKELLTKLYQRASSAESSGHQNALAWFDVGYLVETYGQWFYKDPNPAAGIDGYNLVMKAIALRGQTDAEMEFAAALITLRGPEKAHLAHTQKAMAGAKGDVLLAQNLSNRFLGNSKTTVSELLVQKTSKGVER